MPLVFMILASASFATMSALVKLVGDSIPLAQLIFYRCLVPLPFFWIYLRWRGKQITARARGTVILRSLFGFLAMACFYYALTHLPLAICVFIGRAQPFLLALLAPYIVGESAGTREWRAIAVGMLGVFLILRPGFSWTGAGLIALLGAAFAAVAHLFVRRLGRSDDPEVIVFNFFLLTTLMSGAWSLTYPFSFPAASQWPLIVGIAFFSTIGQFLMTWAYRLGRAPRVAAASYASLLLSIAYGYLIWGELPDFWSWIGAAVILIGIVYLFRARKSK